MTECALCNPDKLDALIDLQRASLSTLRAILAVLEGPNEKEQQPDLEALVSKAQSATELIRMGVLRRSR